MKTLLNLELKINTVILTAGILLAPNLQAETIRVGSLSFSPTLDGSGAEWGGVEATNVALNKTLVDGKSNISTVAVKFGVSADKVCFLMQWDDASHDDQHKPFIWNDGKGKYVAGKQREDRLAIQFAMEGEYDTNWMSGKEFKADIWHWKAARSNPIGIAQDKTTIISKSSIKKAYKGKAQDGSTIYIKRSSDAGDKLYSTKRYSEKEQDIMPKYIMASNPKGSVTDVKAVGNWVNNVWTLEGCRAMNTGNDDDVVFSIGTTVKGGIAAFNHSGNADHNHSATLDFEF